jgi:hypothetical protein
MNFMVYTDVKEIHLVLVNSMAINKYGKIDINNTNYSQKTVMPSKQKIMTTTRIMIDQPG